MIQSVYRLEEIWVEYSGDAGSIRQVAEDEGLARVCLLRVALSHCRYWWQALTAIHILHF